MRGKVAKAYRKLASKIDGLGSENVYDEIRHPIRLNRYGEPINSVTIKLNEQTARSFYKKLKSAHKGAI